MRSYYIRIPSWVTYVYPNAIWKNTDNQVEWTIDDGPDPMSTPLWIELLKEADVKATFFVTASKAEKYPYLINQIVKSGHKVASHGYEHLNGWKSATEEYVRDVQKSISVLDVDLFRPPFGKLTLRQYRAISTFTRIMMWTVMPGDFDPSVTTESLEKRMSTIKKGDIVVLHDRPDCIDKVAPIFKKLYATPYIKPYIST